MPFIPSLSLLKLRAFATARIIFTSRTTFGSTAPILAGTRRLCTAHLGRNNRHRRLAESQFVGIQQLNEFWTSRPSR